MVKFRRDPSRDKSGGSIQRRMVRDYQDVLQNIEAMLIAAHRDSPAVDDHACDAAIHAILAGTTEENPIAQDIVNRLVEMRQTRADVPDEVWNDGLRVVAKSIHTHSSRAPGEMNYLSFVSEFMP
jgi:hypothetical protein